MQHNAPLYRANSSNWSSRRSAPLNNTMWWMPGTVWRPLSWNAGGMKNWKRSRRFGNSLPASKGKRYSLSSEEEARVLWMGENFTEIWHGDHCPPTLKKMIFRTAIEEIIVRTDA